MCCKTQHAFIILSTVSGSKGIGFSNIRNLLTNTPKTPNINQETSASESNSEEFTVPCTPPLKKRKIQDPLLKAVYALEKVSSQTFSSVRGDDEFDLFARTIAQQLRQLPLEAALETEELILSIIRRQRIKLSSTPASTESTRTVTITIPYQQVYQFSSETESIASASGTYATNDTDVYSTFISDDIISQAVSSIL
ncbi:unnamed protein product [Colias eurytheme]|nr:unnamed protein product [Colias eurytheme]